MTKTYLEHLEGQLQYICGALELTASNTKWMRDDPKRYKSLWESQMYQFVILHDAFEAVMVTYLDHMLGNTAKEIEGCVERYRLSAEATPESDDGLYRMAWASVLMAQETRIDYLTEGWEGLLEEYEFWVAEDE